jgi:hypothetical protein
MSRERDEKVDRLLHDAEHAESGARMARIMRDYGMQVEYEKKRDGLIAEAQALDPNREADAWQEATLDFVTKPKPGAYDNPSLSNEKGTGWLD